MASSDTKCVCLLAIVCSVCVMASSDTKSVSVCTVQVDMAGAAAASGRSSAVAARAPAVPYLFAACSTNSAATVTHAAADLPK